VICTFDLTERKTAVCETYTGGKLMIYERPFIKPLGSVESLVDRLFPQRLQASMDWRARRLKDCIDADPARIHSISLNHLCHELELTLSERQARRLFKESAGISIKGYARKRRLAFAAVQLQNTDAPVKAVATDAGYHTHQAFTKSFFDLFRLTPMEFRRIWHRNKAAA
jgi:AraC-like DNA-binding protein